MRFLSNFILCAASALSATAQVAEVLAGIGVHDVSFLTTGSSREDSVAINAEIIFEEPEFLKGAFSPQPYINGSLNLGGKTSYGGAGLLWRQNIGKKFYEDYAFGLVINEYGSCVLFREQVTLGCKVSDKLAV